MKNIQIQLSNLSSYFISNLEILIYHHQYFYQISDECVEVHNQLVEFLAHPHQSQVPK
jgi:hypothetical protein